MKKFLIALVVMMQPLLAVIITNGLPVSEIGHFSVNVYNAGETRDVTITAKVEDNNVTTGIVYDYFTYVQVGARAFRLSSKADNVYLNWDNSVISEGEFTGSLGNTIEWKCVSSIEPNSKIFRNDFSFNSQDNSEPLGEIKLYQYLDEDVFGTANIFFTMGDYAHGNLELFTINPGNSIGISHGGDYFASENSHFIGWAMDSYNGMKGRIRSGNQQVLRSGFLHRTGKYNHPVYGETYGIWDIVSVLAWEVDEKSTRAEITTTLGSVIYSGELNEQRVDLTAGGLKLNYLEDGNITASTRIGNAGLQDLDTNSSVAFILKDKRGTIREKKEIVFTHLAKNSYSDFNVTMTNISGNDVLTVWVDQRNIIRELNEKNNILSLSLNAIAPYGSISVTTDKPKYTNNEIIHLQAQVQNLGKLDANLTAQLILEDMQGNVIKAFEKQPLGIVASGESKTIFNEWNTTRTLTGEYRFRGVLTDRDGAVVDEANATFVIVPDGSADATIDLRLDRALYRTTDTVRMGNVIQSIHSNHIIPNAQVRLRVTDASGEVIHTQDLRLGELLPDATRTLDTGYTFSRLEEGGYTVEAFLLGEHGVTYAQDAEKFSVTQSLLSSLRGSVSLSWRYAHVGARQQCHYQATNLGSAALNSLALQVRVIDMSDGQIVRRYDHHATLESTRTYEDVTMLDTSSYPAHTFSCALYAQDSAHAWYMLDHQLFDLTLLDGADDAMSLPHGSDAYIDVLTNDHIDRGDVNLSTMRLIDPQGKRVTTLNIPGEGVWRVESDGAIRFHPDAGYVGDPTPITYTVRDHQGGIVTASITVNYPPVAYDDTATTLAGESIEIAVLENDRATSSKLDPESLRLLDGNESVVELVVLDVGRWEVDVDKGVIFFYPEAGFAGDANVTYMVDEIDGDSSNRALLSVHVSGEGDTPCWCDDVATDSGGTTNIWLGLVLLVLIVALVRKEYTTHGEEN